jgi:ketosteroid isomerase-like protein
VRAMLDCMNAGDPEGQLAHCTDDIVYEIAYFDLPDRVGIDALRSMFGGVYERFDSVDYQIVDHVPTVDPDLVIVEVRGNNKVKGSDNWYRNHYVMFLYFRDGKVYRWREFSNPNVYAEAVGGH